MITLSSRISQVGKTVTRGYTYSSVSSLSSYNSNSNRYIRQYCSKKKESQEEIDDKKDAKYLSKKFDQTFPPQNYSDFYPNDPQRKQIVTQFTENDMTKFRTRKDIVISANSAEYKHGLDQRDYNIASFLSMEEEDKTKDPRIFSDKLTDEQSRELEEEMDAKREERLDKEIEKIQEDDPEKAFTLKDMADMTARYEIGKVDIVRDLKATDRAIEEAGEEADVYYDDVNDPNRAFLTEKGYTPPELRENQNSDRDVGKDSDDPRFQGVNAEDAEGYGMQSMYNAQDMRDLVGQEIPEINLPQAHNELEEFTDALNDISVPDRISGTTRILTKKRIMRVRQHTRVTKGGRINSFSALVLVGNGEGSGGIGYGKGETVAVALKRATRDAERKAFTLFRFQDKIIPTGLDLHYRSTKVRFYRFGGSTVQIGGHGHKQRFINTMFGLQGVNYRTYGQRGWRAILNVFQYALPGSWINPDELSTLLGKKFITREYIKEKKLSLANLLTSRIPDKNTDPYNYSIIGKFLTDLEQPKGHNDIEYDNLYATIDEMLQHETNINRDQHQQVNENNLSINQKSPIDPMNKWKRSKYLASKKMEQARFTNPSLEI